MKKATLELNPEQYKTLLKLAFTGNWVDERNDSVTTELIQQLCGMAKELECENLVQTDPETNTLMPSDELFNELMDTTIAYEEDVFWESLVHRMSERDKLAEIGEEKYEQADMETRMEMVEPLYEKYEKEFSEHGINRLVVKE